MPSGWMPASNSEQKTLFAEFLAPFCEHPVCNPDASGETIHTSLRRRPRLPHGGRTDLRKKSILRLQEEAPPHDLRMGRGRCTDLAFPDAHEDDESGGGA